jgi:diguanylate cyclase (GGDEF)-like protein/putative nucleotidyltransferase with HDIG domain
LTTGPQIRDFLYSSRIVLILWGTGATGGVIWTLGQQHRLDPASAAVLVSSAVVPFLGLCYYYRVYARELRRLRNHAGDMADLFNSTLSTLALAIDAKDKQRQGHTLRVQKYSRAIAEGLRLDTDQIVGIAAAALLHDIGKLAIPEYILNKRGGLTREEMRKMRMHPQLGADIISNINFPYPVAESILAHHERFDGKGYPNGIAGKKIPLGARVLAIADAFDAYISDRIESNETLEAAMRSIRQGSGMAFDPDIVEVWASLYREVVVWSSDSGAHTGIHQATSEFKLLESLTEAIQGLTSVHDILFAVRAHITKSIRGCVIERGEREGIQVSFGGKVMATICCERPGVPLSDDELRLIHAVAGKVAPALNNALAIEAARREATVDKLTGLANRRAFEMMSASLDTKHYSIVLIDVNSFKSVNDNFGHTTGDSTLVRIAAHLHTAFPDAQLICRLGGDEFLVVSFAAIRALRAQIRRFRRMVVADPAHTAYKSMLFGVSCGVASIPANAKNIEQAMQHADERMYAFKARYKEFAVRAVASAQAGTTLEARSRRENIRSPFVAKK